MYDQSLEALCDNALELEAFYSAALLSSRQLPEDAIFVEVGTRMGGTALTMLEAIRDSGKRRWLFTIDPYGGKPYRMGQSVTKDMYTDEMYGQTMAKLANASVDMLHCHWRLTSQDFLRVFPTVGFWHEGKPVEPKYGFVYLDGEHHSDIITMEFEGFHQDLMEGGMIVIDDILCPEVRDEKLEGILGRSEIHGSRSYYVKRMA